MARHRWPRWLRHGDRNRPADPPLPRAPRAERRWTCRAHARARVPRGCSRDRRCALRARNRRMGGRRGQPTRLRAPRALSARGRRAALALADRRRRARARARDGQRQGGGGRRAPARPRRSARAPRADTALHLAQRPRRAVRVRDARRRVRGGRLRVRKRVPRRRRRLDAGRRMVFRGSRARGSGARTQRSRRRVGRREVLELPHAGRDPRGDGRSRALRRIAAIRS
jgi:hypothetical protein